MRSEERENDYQGFANCRRIDAAAACEPVRVTVRTINSIERGEYNPSLVLAYKIAQVFHTTVEELCCLKENVECEENQDEDHK